MILDDSWTNIKEKRPREKSICKVYCEDKRITEAYTVKIDHYNNQWGWFDPISHSPLNIKVNYWKY